jgi:hypothetical protein
MEDQTMTTRRVSPSLIGASLIAVLLLTGCANQYGRHDRRDDDGHRRDAPASDRDRHDRPSNDQDRRDGPPR